MSEETRLAGELARRVDGMPDQPLTFEDVHGRARRIRRRRRAGVAAAVAAAVAVVVPTVLFSGAGGPRVDDPPVVHQLQTLDLGDVTATGPAPAVPYLEGDHLVHPGEDPLSLERPYTAFDLVPGALFGQWSDESGHLQLDVVDSADGRVTDARPGLAGLATSDDGLVAAEGRTDGSLGLLSRFDLVPILRAGGPAPVPVAVTGRCAEGDCAVYYNTERTGGFVVDAGGTTRRVTDDAVYVADASESGLVAVRTSADDSGTCVAVHDEDAASYLWRSCEYDLLSFSPDGRYLVATDPMHDGLGLTTVSVLDAATGDEVVRYRAPRNGHIDQGLAWEAGDQLLAAAYVDGEWSVYRLGTDGSMERALGPVAGADVEPPFRLPGRF